MEKVALLQEMVAIAGTLKGSKLKGLSKIEASIEEVVSGTPPTLMRLTTICSEEKISSRSNGRRMGF